MASRNRPSKASSAFAAFLDRGALRRMAGGLSFERGEDYFDEKRVKAITEHERAITATVEGSRSYRVKLWIEDEDLEYSCACPVGADGEFCKHCVALGLGWLEGDQRKRSGKSDEPAAVSIGDVRSYLSGQDKSALVEMLVERAMEDDRLRQSLLMKVAKKDSKAINLATYRQAIDDAVELDGFVNYRNVHGYVRGIEEAIDSLEELLKEGYAARSSH